MLESFRDGIWTLQRPQRFWGVDTGTRTTIVRMSDGGLFVHCPVALDDELRRRVDELGPVRAVVASSLFHHLYVGQWMEAFPSATFHPCPGLAQKRPDLTWGSELGDAPESGWSADIDQASFTSRFEKEIVFLHRKTNTLICADALLNLSHHSSRLTRTVAFLMGNNGPGKGYFERIAVRDWKLGRKQVDRILEWDIDGIVLAHGALVPHDGRAAVREAYTWL